MIEKLQIIQQRFDEVSDLIIQPDVITDQKRYIQLNKEYKELSVMVEKMNQYKIIISNLEEAELLLKDEQDEEMIAMAKMEIESAKENLPKLEEEIKFLLIPKEVIFEVSGDDVYGTLKYESGVHRVQRVPQTETQGRVHTSAATVMVLPEAEEFDIEIDMNEVRVDYFCSSGPGGQSVNTTYSAVRLTHEPSGIVAQCQDQKSQHKNKDKALKVLRSRLYELELSKKLALDSEKRNSLVSSGDRSAKIRTYNYPQGRVTDHRIGLTLYDLPNVINGDVQKLIDELQLYQNTEKLKEAGEVL